jgi:hypothetical protein
VTNMLQLYESKRYEIQAINKWLNQNYIHVHIIVKWVMFNVL